jgi:hypothetical protein
VPGPFDIGDLLILSAGRQIVNRREMEEVRNLALELLQVGVGNPQIRLPKIADDRDHLLFVDSPLFAHRLEFLLRSLANQHVDGLATLYQVRDQEAADEPGRTGDKVRHELPP